MKHNTLYIQIYDIYKKYNVNDTDDLSKTQVWRL